MIEQRREDDSIHPWEQFYDPNSSNQRMHPIFSQCTLEHVQQFRNTSKNQWINESRTFNTAKKSKSVFKSSAALPNGPFAFYSIIASRGNVLILTPVFNEVVADDRLDLQLIHMNKNAIDTMNPGKFSPSHFEIGSVIFITKLHKKRRLKGLSIDQFHPKDVRKPGGKHFWEVAEYHPAPTNIEDDVLTTPYRLINDKFLCVAENFEEVIEMPNTEGYSINQLLSTSIFVPSITPGQFLSTLKKEEGLNVARRSPKLVTSNTYAPHIREAFDASIDDKNIFNDYRQAFHVWDREEAYDVLKKVIEFGSNGLCAIRNSHLDTNHYTTRIGRYSVHHPYVYFSFILAGANCAKWNQAVAIRVSCETNAMFFFADVMSVRRSSGRTLKIRARSFNESLIEEFRSQNVVVFQKRDLKASEINYDIKEGSHADTLIQALYGGRSLQEVQLPPNVFPVYFRSITLNDTQMKYYRLVSHPEVSALIGSSSFGCGKTTAIAAAALFRKIHRGKPYHMVTANTDSAVLAIIRKLEQLDPNVGIVRIIDTSDGLSQFDYPKLLADFLLQQIQEQDNFKSENIPWADIYSMLSYLKDKLLLSKSDLKSNKLQNMYDKSKFHNQENLLNLYLKANKPKVIVGTLQSICNAFTCLWKQQIKKIVSIQIDEASTLPRETILQLITLFPKARYSLVGDYHTLSPCYVDGACQVLIDAAVRDTLRECVTDELVQSVDFNGVIRCQPELTQLLGSIFYDSSLESLHKKNTEFQMALSPAWRLQKHNHYPIVLIDTEKTTHQPLGTSLRNIQEAELAMNLATHLLKFVKKKKEDIAILCFYEGQMSELHDFSAEEGIYVGSIDSAQGREWPICIICTTRTDTFVESRSLTSSNRIKFALSRSKHLNFILGHVSSMRNAIYWGDVVEKCEEKETSVKAEDFSNMIRD